MFFSFAFSARWAFAFSLTQLLSRTFAITVRYLITSLTTIHPHRLHASTKK